MEPYRCPECGSLRVRFEFRGTREQDASGVEVHDPVSEDVSPDGYAECAECGHSGITEDFEP